MLKSSTGIAENGAVWIRVRRSTRFLRRSGLGLSNLNRLISVPERSRVTGWIIALAGVASLSTPGCFFGCVDGPVYFEVTGRVLDAATSDPVAEAEIALRLFDSDGMMIIGFGGPPEEGVIGTTGGNGSFSLNYAGAVFGGCGLQISFEPLPGVARVELAVRTSSGESGVVSLPGDQVTRSNGLLDLGDLMVSLDTAP